MIMKNKMRFLLNIILLLLISINLSSQEKISSEMRAVWIATVKNVDYPSNKNLSVEEQKKEFIDMLDVFSKIGINAVFFQVRPAADAFFQSDYEPWSEWLTGKQGKAPEPYYDPLKFMIKEAHKRNIQFHAWINPFRAVATIEYADICENHISKRKPEWIFTYDINKYFNPGIPEVRNYITNIIIDIVKRYDIDGVHFDDYFYPYPKRNEFNRLIRIPDDETFLAYNSGFNTIEDWRRNNMNLFIQQVNNGIKSVKPNMPFGVAPSGVWRNKSNDPNGSNTRALSHYDALYADVLKWLKNGWIDYVVPQLYWTIGNTYADYNTLVNWWSEHTYGKHLYIGHAVYLAKADASSESWKNPKEIPKQIRIARKNPNVQGAVFYKAKSLMENNLGIADSLKNNFYKMKVKVPEMPWLVINDTAIVADYVENKTTGEINKNIPRNFSVLKLGNKLIISWEISDIDVLQYNVYKSECNTLYSTDNSKTFKTTKENYIVLNRKRINFFRKKYCFTVSSVSITGNESKKSEQISISL